MRSIRDIKRQARRDLHQKGQVAALYLGAPESEPLAITVRVHTAFAALVINGSNSGSSNGLATREDVQPKIIFMLDQMPTRPFRNHVVSVESGEAYRIEFVEAPDDITITAHVVVLTAEECHGLPVPAAS